jgi:two-component system, chemotaxis family, sensor kinase CheA
MNTSAFIAKFAEEARDRLKSLTAAVLRLEEAPGDTEAIAEVLRECHNLKGSARMLGLLDISQVSHRIEELFVRARTAVAPKADGHGAGQSHLLNASAFDTVFGALDALSLRVEQLASGMTTSVDVTALCESLAALVSESAHVQTESAAESDTEPSTSAPEAVASTAVAHVGTRQTLRVPVERLDGLTHLAAELVIQSLKTSERQAELRRIDTRIGRLRDRMREARLAPGGQPAGNDLTESAETLEHVSRHLRQVLASFSDDCVRLNLITEEFRQTVIELTMLPLGTVFDAFPRAARDLARQFGKEVEVTIRGRETELDKKIIEQISDPLIHLLRNAIDHGIETPEERSSQGKPASGQLLISAEQQGNRIIVTVRDDGKGIDPESLRTAAVRDGLAPAADLQRWTEPELLDLVFQPGFSTRDAATDVSGRGVGMDVVRAVVLRLGGAVKVQSVPGQGTTIVLDLPLSLALLRVVLVETAGEMFALPTAAVRRVLHLKREDLRNADGLLSLDLDGESIPLAALSVLLNGTMAPFGLRQPVLTVAAGDHIFALIVDAVHEEQELVFEELRHPLRDQRTFAGAAILGNGDIVPILDVHALHELTGHAPTGEGQAAPAPRTAARAARVLVVEDSLVAGEMQKSILVAAGYDVEIAHDGAEAMEMLGQRAWDLVVADVDMPRMDGFELTQRMRADERFRTLPIIIVTARDSAEDRRRGFTVGADAYVLKREFDQIQLLDIVQRLISRAAPTRA